MINTERVPDRSVRRALALAVDRAASPPLRDRALQATATLTFSSELTRLSREERDACSGAARGLAHVSAGATYCYTPPAGLAHDPAAARRELARAPRASRPSTITFNRGILGHEEVARFVQQSWRDSLGVTTSLKTLEWKTFLVALTNGDYDVARMGWMSHIPDPLADFLPPFRCGDPNNRARWCNRRYDQLIASALDEPDLARRLELASKAEQLLLDEAVVIPLHVYGQRWLRRRHVRGMRLNLLDRRSLAAVWLDRPGR